MKELNPKTEALPATCATLRAALIPRFNCHYAAATSIRIGARLVLWGALPLLLAAGSLNSQAENLAGYVNPWMGTLGKGSTVIGPQLPWGSVNPSPDTPDGHTDGYNPTKKIRGFSQLHVTGTGGPGKYGQFLISPQVGLSVGETNHDSAKSEEEPAASSYKVRLTDYNILCELTPTRHAAIYRFTFPKSDKAHILFDAGHNIPSDASRYGEGFANKGQIFVDAKAHLVRGWGHYWGGWSAQPFRVYFAARFDQPAAGFGTWKDGVVAPDVATQEVTKQGDRIGGYLQFHTAENEPVFVKIAVSFVSMDKALAYLDKEIPAWDFAKVKADAEAAWNRQLEKISIEGASEDEKTIFYTALYNTMRMPRDRSGDNPHWKSSEPYWDDHYCVWDTWKTLFPLQVLINQSMVRDNVKAFIDRFKENGQVKDAFIAGNDRVYEWRGKVGKDSWLGNQGGDDVNNIVADAFLKGVSGVDWQAAYEMLNDSAGHERAPSYRALNRGWVPFHSYEFGLPCSRTLEFCYNDFCVAEVAQKLGKNEDAARYFARSEGWTNLWNPWTESDGFKGFIAPRWMNGAWVEYDPKSDHAAMDLGGFGPDRCFYEGNSWIYSYLVPQDYARLIRLCGGRDAYCARLQHALEKDMIDFGNEPSFLTPFSFIYAGRPDLASFWVRKNIGNYTEKGFPGDEDSGAMGSWLVFATMGLFPVAGQDIYLINGPLYPKMTVRMENGKQIVIEGVHASPANVYVQSATLNGRPLDQAWLRHADIKNGAVLKFVMGPEPSDWGKASVPPSLSSR